MGLFFDKAVIVGVGLLGGSVGLALKARRMCGKVVGLGRSRDSVATALKIGAIDEAAPELEDAVKGADLVVVCTPVGSTAGIIAEMESLLEEDCIITDVGSTKRDIVCAVEQLSRAGSRFVGGHPLAGSEKKGVQHASSDLFEKATVFLTPVLSTDQAVAEKVRQMWECLGGKVVEIEPEIHDSIMARTSHLPHIVAALLVSSLRSLPERDFNLIGRGFLDTTRIASSDPEMWADICMSNADGIREAIFLLRQDLDEFDLYMSEGEYQKIIEFFRSVKLLRDSLNHESNDG